jgi:hypothetical protein
VRQNFVKKFLKLKNVLSVHRGEFLEKQIFFGSVLFAERNGMLNLRLMSRIVLVGVIKWGIPFLPMENAELAI